MTRRQAGHGYRRGAVMELGAFSVSLSVRDLEASRTFYETLGFSAFHGDAAQGWLILKNGTTVIGLFEGMLERNMLTFNPGWDGNAQPIQPFTDVREIQRHLRERGVALAMEADEGSSGPASVMVMDPDGNPILFDQHV
jgi:catechol 2,3-dioxygenase-like lactoylglutathione lyase family enzyme